MEQLTCGPSLYTPLNTCRREVRLLKIISNPGSEIIQCLSKTYRLDTAPPYVALSYEWGHENDQQRIEVNNCPVLARSNLWSFLRQRGGPDDFEWIWIDALCIDQANLSERSHQVGFMAQIFRQAILVLAWLGPSSYRIDMGLNILEMNKFSYQFHQDKEQFLYVVESLGLLCKRSYWTRLWVLQELVLALEIMVSVGHHLIPWSRFRAVLLDLKSLKKRKEKSIMSDDAMREFIQPSPAFSMFKQLDMGTTNVTLLARVLSVPRLLCEEPKDRIYALLGICKPGGAGQIYPDYEADNVQLVQDVLLHAEPDEFGGIEPFANFTSHIQEVSAVLGVNPSQVFKLDTSSAYYALQQQCRAESNGAGIIFWWAVSKDHRHVQQFCLRSCGAVLNMLPDTESQDVQETFELIASLPDFGSSHDLTGYSPLHHAVLNGSAITMRRFLQHQDININICARANETFDYTPLMLAARKGNEDVVDLLLLRQDLDVNFRSTKDIQNSDTALILATSHGHEAIVAKLLSRPDIDVNCYSRSHLTPLQLAAREGHVGIVAKLLSNSKIDVNCFSQPQLGPLQLAVCGGYEAVVRQLLQRQDIHINDRKNTAEDSFFAGKTALMIAARFGYHVIVRQLLDRSDIDVNCGTDDGNATALQLAIHGGHEAIASLLLQREDLNVNHRCKRRITLDPESHTSSSKILSSQISHPYDCVWEMSCTALMMAAGLRNEPIVCQLLQKPDLDINCRIMTKTQFSADSEDNRSSSSRMAFEEFESSRATKCLAGGSRMSNAVAQPLKAEFAVVAWGEQDLLVNLKALHSNLWELSDEIELLTWEKVYRPFISAVEAAVAGNCVDLARYLCSYPHQRIKKTRDSTSATSDSDYAKVLRWSRRNRRAFAAPAALPRNL